MFIARPNSNEIQAPAGRHKPDRLQVNQDLMMLAFHAAPPELGLVCPLFL